MAERIEQGGSVSQLARQGFAGKSRRVEDGEEKKEIAKSEAEDKLRAAMGRRGGGSE